MVVTIILIRNEPITIVPQEETIVDGDIDPIDLGEDAEEALAREFYSAHE